MLPFRFGSDAEFAAAREFLAGAGYTTAAICERLGLKDLGQFKPLGEGRATPPEVNDRLDALIRMFLDGMPVEAPVLARLLGDDGLAALAALRLVGRHPEAPDRWAARVMLYPMASLYIASDLGVHAPGLFRAEELMRPDAVFPALTSNTHTFLQQLPATPCERLLELCAGTGIAALAGARSAGHAWAVDITERSTRFAEFNARLNGIDNVTALQGDLYAPVAGLTFDRIVAHPPYVPASGPEVIFRDAGEDGEAVFRRLIEGLPDHLERGGRLYCTCMATDRAGATLEDRIRGWLGEAEAEFDLLVVTHFELPPTDYYLRLASMGVVPWAIAEQRSQLYKRLEAERILYLTLVAQRHGPRPSFSVRRENGEGAGAAEADALVAWMTAVSDGSWVERLAAARPRLSDAARLVLTHAAGDGGWTVTAAKVQVEYPFRRTVELSVNVATLLTLFDGTATAPEHLRRLRDSGAFPPEMPDAAFVKFLGDMVAEGVLRLDGGAPVEAAPAG
ncbi:MAG: methyltransferase [Gemmatimonadetes bacterium]|nr:methyltransferase [Gemmatimonadota bacterium]